METKKITKEQVKTWVKDHKKDIAAAALGGVAGGILTVLGYKKYINRVVTVEATDEIIKFIDEQLANNEVSSLYEISGKKLGKYLCKKYPKAIINGFINVRD